MMAIESMLTTVDNPHDPFTDYDNWYQWDERAGYHSTSFLARIIQTSNDISDADQDLAIDLAIDEIVKENVSGVHTKVMRENTA
jgi:hypothetical protein